MASQAQIVANRANALKSTGPKTSQGKAVVSQNAVKHGLLAEQVVIAGEDPGAFESYREAMLGELAPVGVVETTLAERVVGLAWRLRRAERVQAEVFDALLAKDAASSVGKLLRSLQNKSKNSNQGDGPEDTALGRVVIRDFANNRVLDRLGMYERRIEQSLYKTMAELQKLRVVREMEPPASEKSEGETRGLRTHPTIEKSEGRDSNDKNEVASVGGSVKAEGLGDGETGGGFEYDHATVVDHARQGAEDFVKQTQFSGQVVPASVGFRGGQDR